MSKEKKTIEEPSVNLRRPKPVFVRLSAVEKEHVTKKAKAIGISLSAWARCKMFDLPFDHVSGRMTAIPKSNKARSKATKATP